MNRSFRFTFFILLFTGFSLQGFAFHPKWKPGINEGAGTGTGIGENEVKLPIGLPFQITDPTNANGSSNEDGGVPVDQPAKIVYTFDLPDGQGPQSVHETHSAFEQARSMNAACVLIRMNSMSGALSAAENISNEILDYDRPVMVYVNDKAISATTLISMAADNKKAKIKSLKNSGTSKNRITSANPGKKNTTFSIDENSCTSNLTNAQINKNQFTTSQNGDLDEVLTQAGLNNYTVVHYSPGFFAQMIDFCMKPWVSLLLVLLISIGIRTQIETAFPGPATFLLLVSIPLFGIPLFVGGLAGIGEFGLVIFLAGVIIFHGRKKSPSLLFKIILIAFFLAALTLCQSGNFAGLTNWEVPLISLLLTSATFSAGWFAPIIFRKSLRNSNPAVSPAV